MKRRGPDATNITHPTESSVMLHNLLHITGSQPVAQPYTNNDQSVFILFNGEIFNYLEIAPNATSDTKAILVAYERYGDQFPKYLDGEFAILLYDLKNQKLIVTSDVFMTKPLFCAEDSSTGELAFASYASALHSLDCKNVQMFKPNCTLVYSIKQGGTWSQLSTNPVYKFDLVQKKRSFDDWEKAFMHAVKKRALHGNTDKSLFVLMSSGYDSGAITLALNLMKIPYASFSSFKNEDAHVLQQRINMNHCHSAHHVQEISEHDRQQEAALIREHSEPFTYVHNDGPGMRLNMCDDGGARAANHICRAMSQKGYRILLSGSGADEIYSDYGFKGQKLYYHSEFGGLFPENLETLFPWRKFYDDTQRSYLFKDEFIAGTHQIEGRYPFLDPHLVQEWLWIHPMLKNEQYKAPLRHLFLKYKYPFNENVKTGFGI